MARPMSLPEKMAAFARAEALFKPLPKEGSDIPLSPARYCACQRPPWDNCDHCDIPQPVTRSMGAAP